MASAQVMPDDQSFPKFEINLDLPPEQRFVEPAVHFKEDIIATVEEYLTQIPKFLQKFMSCFYWTWKITQPTKYKEIQGVVDAINDPRITIQKAVLTNVLYELESWCTSIVAQMKNGTIIHARNLDFDNPANMRKITYRASFTRNGEEVFESVMFSGVVGVYTGIKKGAFSVSENQRFPNKNPLGLLTNLFMIVTGFEEISWRIRTTLETCDTYDCAYKYLSRKSIDGLGYIILAGTKPGEGAVISRRRFSTAHVNKLDADNGKWFLVQTNSDHWKKNVGCQWRCEHATDNMNKIGQDNINISNLRQSVLLRYPNLNNSTLYSTQFIPSTGFIDTISVIYPTPTAEEVALYADDLAQDRPVASIGDILSFKTVDMSTIFEDADLSMIWDFTTYGSSIMEMLAVDEL